MICPACGKNMELCIDMAEGETRPPCPGDLGCCDSCSAWLVHDDPPTTTHLLTETEWHALPDEARALLLRELEPPASVSGPYPTVCPACGIKQAKPYGLTAATMGRGPQPGDLGICWSCYEWFVLDNPTSTAHILTKAEWKTYPRKERQHLEAIRQEAKRRTYSK